MTSTTENGRASFESQGLSSFSSYFWNAVFRGSDLWAAFNKTRNAVSYLTQSLVALGLLDAIQMPQIDDNGNGIANEDEEGSNASLSHIGLGIITGSDDYISADVEKNIRLEGEPSALLSVSNIRSSGEVARVWAVVTAPAVLEESEAVLPLPLLYLVPAGSGGYQWMYSDFSVQGKYYADFFALDSLGTVSLLGRTTILQTAQPEPDAVTWIEGSSGLVMANVSLKESLKLDLSIDLENKIQDGVAHEWLVVALGNFDGNINFYLFSPAGVVDPFQRDINLSNYTFPFDHSRSTMNLGTLSLESLGLGSGDFFAYAYVYTEEEGLDDILVPAAVYLNSVLLMIN